ncbi:MAG: TolC family protein [Woeseia sp.]
MIRQLFWTCTALSMAGCTVGPRYAEPVKEYPDTWSHEESSAGTRVTSPDAINTQWWNVFEDPLLEQFIATAAEHNKDLDIAMANVRSARALRQIERSSLLPSIGASVGGSRTKSSAAISSFNSGQIRNTYDAGFDASWEIDLFGANRRAYEGSDARVGAAIANYQDVMQSTLSDVARTYYEARGLQKRIANTKQSTQLLKETFDVVRDRFTVGETSDFDLSRAQSEYELTHARIPNLEGELKVTIYTLSVLLGRPPEALLAEMESVQPLPVPPDMVPVGLRSDILRRRPDIRAAERALAASVADIGAQTAELFPSFFLTGDIGSQARVFGDLANSSAGVWSLASFFQWSVFDGGAIRARLELQEAESVAALAQYEKSVLEALRDAEAALSRYAEELETRQRLAKGVQSRRKAVALAKDLFDAGEEDYLAVVDAERQLIASEDDLIISETNSITKLVALFDTLGGGWETFSPEATD